MSENGYPKVVPAFTIKVEIDAPLPVGSNLRKTPLAVAPMVGGTLTSELSFEPSLNATFKGIGNDYIHSDPDGKRMRLNAHAVAETDDGALIYLNYTGVVAITPAVGAVLSGAPDAKTTEFGGSFTHFTFETGSEKYKDLEAGVFVAAGRFVVPEEKGGKTVVEYRVGKVGW